MMHEAQEGYVRRLQTAQGALESTEAETSNRISRSIELLNGVDGNVKMLIQAMERRVGLTEVLKRNRDS